jgi:hypothetical protein
MYFSSYLFPYISIITFIFFIAPLLRLSIKRNTFKPFTLQKLTSTFNFSLIYCIIFTTVLSIGSKVLDIVVYTDTDVASGNTFTEAIVAIAYIYIVIAVFIYLPSVGVLNLINFVFQRLAKK